MSKLAKVHTVLSNRKTIYKLSPPFVASEYNYGAEDYIDVVYEFVAVSCAVIGYKNEVLVFPSDGKSITSWSEIGGSYDEEEGHVSALKKMGYEIDASKEHLRSMGVDAPKAEGEGLGSYK